MSLTQSMSLEAGMLEASAWWVLYTRHQHEKTVAEMLSAKGFEVFLPLYESITALERQKARCLPCRCFPAMSSSGEDSIADCRS